MTLTREDYLRSIRDAADDLLHMKLGDVTLISVSCGYGRTTKKTNGGKGWKTINLGCQWRTNKGEEAWHQHMKEVHPRAKINKSP